MAVNFFCMGESSVVEVFLHNSYITIGVEILMILMPEIVGLYAKYGAAFPSR
jgi:hypothetical protein